MTDTWNVLSWTYDLQGVLCLSHYVHWGLAHPTTMNGKVGEENEWMNGRPINYNTEHQQKKAVG